MEIWKDVEGYKNYYQVSNGGRVKSLSRIIIKKNQYGYFNYPVRERILKYNVDKKGYLYCILYKEKRKTYFIHCLVAQAFIENPENKPEVNHINGIKENCCVGNLEWMTRIENMKDAIENGLINNKGKNHPIARPVVQVDILGNVIKKFDCISDAQRELGINHSNIVAVCRGRQKTAGSFSWEYIDN